MSTTAQQVFEITMALADEIGSGGVIDSGETSDYKVRTPGILNAIQPELIKQGDLYSTYEISNKPITNMLGDRSGFDYLEFLGEDIIKEAPDSVKAYYFEVDGDCTVYIEDYTTQWNTLATVTATSVSDFTAYKGVVTPTDGATKSRIRFSGTYRYLATNYSMFSAPLSPSKIPDYRPWVKRSLPADFKSVEQIISETADVNYEADVDYKWEGKADFYISYSFEGNIRIVYRPVPVLLTSTDDYVSLDDVTARSLLPYALGMELFKEENVEIYGHFVKRYTDLKAASLTKRPATEEMIIDIYREG